MADLRATLGSYPRHSDLEKMTQPVLCTYGSRSGNYMRAITRALAESIPTATVRQIDGAAHAVPFDAPITFARVIADASAVSEIRMGSPQVRVQHEGATLDTRSGPERGHQ